MMTTLTLAKCPKRLMSKPTREDADNKASSLFLFERDAKTMRQFNTVYFAALLRDGMTIQKEKILVDYRRYLSSKVTEYMKNPLKDLSRQIHYPDVLSRTLRDSVEMMVIDEYTRRLKKELGLT